jgi:hypothetical protein
MNTRTILALAFALFHAVCVTEAQESFVAHGSTVVYAPPDPAIWNTVNNGIDEGSKAFLLMFKRAPVEDPQGRKIEPVIALICESMKEPLDVIKYSILKRVSSPFDVKKMLSFQGGDFTYPNSIGYEGQYDIGVLHKLIIGHMRHKEVGVQVICDSTDGVYDKVESDMKSFLRSVTFKD